jgi:Pyridoxamine 5'-phosphate oxidase
MDGKGARVVAVEPVAGRPLVPAGYGISKEGSGQDLLPWGTVSGWLEAARNYWVVTASPEGRAHAMPVWGVWLEGAVFFSTDPASRKAQNLEANPRLIVHLESGEEVAVLEGVARKVRDRGLRERVAATYSRKYEMDAGLQDESALLYELRPQVALTWYERNYPQSATRWRFDSDGAGEEGQIEEEGLQG